MAKVVQEFYCTTSGGGCGGYFLAPLNQSINGIVEVCCPNCGHKHQRVIEDGHIKEQGRFHGQPTQEIITTKATFQMTPHTMAMQDRTGNERDAVVVQQDLVSDGKGTLLNGMCRWIERFGDKR